METETGNARFKRWLLGGLLIALPLLSYPLAVIPREAYEWPFLQTLLGTAPLNPFDILVPWGRIAVILVISFVIWRYVTTEENSVTLRAPRGWSALMGIFALATLLSFAWSTHREVARDATVTTFASLTLAWTATRWGSGSPLRLQKIMRCGIAASALMAVYALFQINSLIGQIIRNWPSGIPWGLIRNALSQSEAVATLGNRNLLADYLIFSLPLIFAWALSAREAISPSNSTGVKKSDRWKHWTMVVLLSAALLLTLYFCRSRAAWGALTLTAVIGVAGWFAISKPQHARWVLIGFIALGAAGFFSMLPQLKTAFSEDVRVEIWRGTTRLIRDNPFAGAGPGTFAVAYPPYRTPQYFEKSKAAFFTEHAHNEWLETAAELGILGLLAFVGIFLYAAHQWWHKRQHMTAANWAFALSAIALLVHGTLEVSLRYPPGQALLWLALGLSLSGLPLPQFEWRVMTKWRVPVGLGVGLALLVVAYFFVWLPIKSDTHWRNAKLAEDLNVAVREMERAVAAQPNRVETLYQAATFIERLADQEREKSKELTDADALKEAEVRYKILEYRRWKFLLRLVELAPHHRDVNLRVARWLARHETIQQAVPFFENEVALDVGNPLAGGRDNASENQKKMAAAFATSRYWLAKAYFDTGKPLEACRLLEAARRLNSGDAFIENLIRERCGGTNDGN